MRQTKKILIVEDEALTTQMYKDAFGKMGYYLYAVKNKVEALKKIKEEQPAMILLDLLIPTEDGVFGKFDFRTPIGLDILKSVKQDPATKETKVVVLTNLENDQARLGAMSAGANDFIIKTELTPSQVAERVIGLLES